MSTTDLKTGDEHSIVEHLHRNLTNSDANQPGVKKSYIFNEYSFVM